MNSEGSTRIMIKHEDRVNVNNIYHVWCSSLGELNFFYPPESVGLFDERGLEQGKILNNVPRPFLKILKENGISYQEF